MEITSVKSSKYYPACPRKLKVREDVMNLNGCKRLVGLAGPQPLECIQRWRNKGAEDIIVYENNVDTYIQQQKLLIRDIKVDLCLGDIMTAPYERGTFYDLDFCSSLMVTEGNFAKFEENFMFTFAMRSGKEKFKGFKKGDMMDMFFERRGETIVGDEETEYCYKTTHQREVQTNKGIYHVTTYRDGLPMMTFYKLKTTKEIYEIIQ